MLPPLLACALLHGALALRAGPATEPKIPRQLILTAKSSSIKDLPAKVQERVTIISASNPGLGLRFFGDDECRAYLAKHFERGLSKAFEEADRGSYRGDICRAAVLYREGGYYMDLDMELMTPLQGLVDENTTFMSVYSHYGGILNALVATAPKSLVLNRTLESILEFARHPQWQHSIDNVMGPVTMMRGVRDTVLLKCPEERARVHNCGDDTRLVSRKVPVAFAKEANGAAFLDDVRRKTRSSKIGAYQMPFASPDSMYEPVLCGIAKDPHWSCGDERFRVFVERPINCHFVSKECPAERRDSMINNNNGQGGILMFGLFAQRKDSATIFGWSRFAGCKEPGCGAGGSDP